MHNENTIPVFSIDVQQGNQAGQRKVSWTGCFLPMNFQTGYQAPLTFKTEKAVNVPWWGWWRCSRA